MRTLSGGARHFVEKQHLREDPIPPPHLHALKINNRTLRTTPYPDLCSNEQSALSTGRKSALLAIFACAGIAPVASLPPPRFHRLASLASPPSPRLPRLVFFDSTRSSRRRPSRRCARVAAQAVPPSHHPSQSHRPIRRLCRRPRRCHYTTARAGTTARTDAAAPSHARSRAQPPPQLTPPPKPQAPPVSHRTSRRRHRAAKTRCFSTPYPAWGPAHPEQGMCPGKPILTVASSPRACCLSCAGVFYNMHHGRHRDGLHTPLRCVAAASPSPRRRLLAASSPPPRLTRTQARRNFASAHVVHVQIVHVQDVHNYVFVRVMIVLSRVHGRVSRLCVFFPHGF